MERRRTSGSRKILATTSALFATMLVIAPLAGAAVYNFSLSGATGYGGSGYANGEIIYGATRTRVSIAGEVDDVCPGDGKGIQLRLRARNATGANAQWAVLTDTRDCPPGALIISQPIPFNTSFNIAESRAELWSTEGGSPFATIQTSTWKPYAP